MKVRIVKPGGKRKMYDGRYANLRRAEYIVNSRRVLKTQPGHISMINKAQVADATPMHVKTYLRKAYKGQFLVIDENYWYWIIKRKNNGIQEIQENSEVRERHYYIPKRKARNSQVGGK